MRGRLVALAAACAVLAACGSAPPPRVITDVQVVKPPLPPSLMQACTAPPRPGPVVKQSDAADAIAALGGALADCAGRHNALVELLKADGM